jgi:hypothetical protein
MGSLDKEYVQALAPGQKFQVVFKAGTEAAKLSGEYRTVEIKAGRGRGGTLNVIAEDASGNPMSDVPIEDPRQGVVIAERCFGTSAWPMVQKFSIEGKLIYDADSGKQPQVSVAKQAPSAPRPTVPSAVVSRPKQQTQSFTKQTPEEGAAPITTEQTMTIGPSAKSSFVVQRSQLTAARTHAMSQQPKKIYDCLLPLLEKRGPKNPLLLRFSAVPITSEINGDYTVVSYKKDESAENKLVISLQSLDIPNKVIDFETDRLDIHVKKIEEINAGR